MIDNPVQAIQLSYGDGVGTLLIRVSILGNEVLENRKGRLQTVVKTDCRRNGRNTRIRVAGIWDLDSAAGNAVGVRDPYNQAVFSVKKPANIYDKSSDSITGLATAFNQLMDICNIVPGPKCDPSKSVMDRILMLSDMDVDGEQIANTIICLFAKHCKPMIDAGMVGRILPPAYQLHDPKDKNKKIFVHTQREFFDVISKAFIKNVKVGYGKHEFDKKELNEFIMRNFNYSAKLRNLADRYHCDYSLMERIAWYYHGEPKEQKQTHWKSVMKPYKDISAIKEESHIIITGSIPATNKAAGQYDFIDVPMDDYFHKRVMKFKNIQNVNKDIYGYTINGEKDKSVWDIMHAFDSYVPDDVTRFKGLGELDPEDLLDLCLDPKKREVYIFKFSDFKKDMGKLDIIMSTKKEFMDARAKILMNMRLDDLDLDT